MLTTLVSASSATRTQSTSPWESTGRGDETLLVDGELDVVLLLDGLLFDVALLCAASSSGGEMVHAPQTTSDVTTTTACAQRPVEG
ncbi:MAG TPA: hypothetical protein VES21_07710 [Nocardioidaceae bacterium]|nr:hypothetical protein [Nocardioidaceae bacterium]